MEMTVREQAAWWVTELGEGGADTHHRFAVWLKESPRHVEEFMFFDAIWKELDGIDGARRLDVDQLVASLAEQGPIANVDSLFAPAPLMAGSNMPRARGLTRPVAIAATVLVLLIGALLVPRLFSRTYATAVGEQRAVKLDDGSLIEMNTGSRVRVSFSDRGRNIRLLEGEALFIVAADPRRPFRVASGDTVIQAVGTRFNVYRRPAGTWVAVLEGAVKVREMQLDTGQEASIERDGRILKRANADLDKVVAWRQRRLVFQSDTLAEVAAQFNRYNDMTIVVEGEAARAKKLIGTFDADDPTSLVDFLKRENAFVVEKRAGALVIRSR